MHSNLKYIKLWEDSGQHQDLDSLGYGNAAAEFGKKAERRCPVKSWFIEQGLVDEIIAGAPANSSPTTLRDLAELERLVAEVGPDEIAWLRHVDNVQNLYHTFVDLLSEWGWSETLEGIARVDALTEPLLFWLKREINRPRPFQLARELGSSLAPVIRTDAMTAAYPSGHALTAFTLAGYYSRLVPAAAEALTQLGERIARSRELTAIHWPSDTEISRAIAAIIIDERLLEKNLIQKSED